MKISNLEPDKPFIIPKGVQIKPKNQIAMGKEVLPENDTVSACVPSLETREIIYKGFDLNDVIHSILQCLTDISSVRFYGRIMLLDVLRGANSKKLQEAGLSSLPNYGKLREMDREDISYIIDWLIEKHFIIKTKGLYPVLHPTYEGQHYDKTMTREQILALKNKLESSEKSGDESL